MNLVKGFDSVFKWHLKISTFFINAKWLFSGGITWQTHWAIYQSLQKEKKTFLFSNGASWALLFPFLKTEHVPEIIPNDT